MSACYHYVVLYIQIVEIWSEFKNYIMLPVEFIKNMHWLNNFIEKF